MEISMNVVFQPGASAKKLHNGELASVAASGEELELARAVPPGAVTLRTLGETLLAPYTIQGEQ